MGCHFENINNIEKKRMNILKKLAAEDLEVLTDKWEQRLHQCVVAQGNFLKGYNVDVWENKNFEN